MIQTGEVRQKEFFMKYYLDDYIQEQIIEKICKKYKISGWILKQIKTEIFLGCAPNGVKISD